MRRHNYTIKTTNKCFYNELQEEEEAHRTHNLMRTLSNQLLLQKYRSYYV